MKPKTFGVVERFESSLCLPPSDIVFLYNIDFFGKKSFSIISLSIITLLEESLVLSASFCVFSSFTIIYCLQGNGRFGDVFRKVVGSLGRSFGC